jgi:hypothetical protein
MLDSGMTFEEWATQIDTRVVQAVPGVSVIRKIDDLFRWIHNGRECQVLALSESAAAFVSLRRNGAITDCSFSCRIAIAPASEEQVACSIIGWLQT